MELKQAISERVSIRHFLGDPVPKKDIEYIIGMSALAPSAGNAQMWHFVVLTNTAVIKELSDVVQDKAYQIMNLPGMEDFKQTVENILKFSVFFGQAPALIAVIMEPYHSRSEEILVKLGLSYDEARKMRGFPDVQSIGAAIQNILLAAYELGYGTCWMTGPLFARVELEKILKVEKPRELIALIPLGKPAETPAPRPRKPIGEIITWIE